MAKKKLVYPETIKVWQDQYYHDMDFVEEPINNGDFDDGTVIAEYKLVKKYKVTNGRAQLTEIK